MQVTRLEQMLGYTGMGAVIKHHFMDILHLLLSQRDNPQRCMKTIWDHASQCRKASMRHVEVDYYAIQHLRLENLETVVSSACFRMQ